MGPLHGVKIVEIAGIGPGPFCGMLLADMGAHVIRVARAGASDPAVEIPARFDLIDLGALLRGQVVHGKCPLDEVYIFT